MSRNLALIARSSPGIEDLDVPHINKHAHHAAIAKKNRATQEQQAEEKHLAQRKKLQEHLELAEQIRRLRKAEDEARRQQLLVERQECQARREALRKDMATITEAEAHIEPLDNNELSRSENLTPLMVRTQINFATLSRAVVSTLEDDAANLKMVMIRSRSLFLISVEPLKISLSHIF